MAAIVDDLFDTPVARVAHVATRHHVTYPMELTDLRKLDHAGILTPLSGAAQISYFCRPIMEAIYTD